MIKNITFTVMHFSIAFTVAWMLTGDVMVGGLVATVEPAINSVAYVFHEKIWRNIQQKRSDAATQNTPLTIPA